MKLPWFNIVCVIIIAALIYFIWHQGNGAEKIMADVSVKARLNDSLKQSIIHRDSSDRVRDRAVIIHDSLNKIKDDSVNELVVREKDSLRTAKISLRQLVARLGEQIEGLQDTSIQRKYDSVVAELEFAYSLVGNYSTTSDTSTAMLIRERDYSDSLNTVLSDEVRDLKLALTSCTLNFDSLKNDADKLNDKLKARGLLNKIGATVVAILAATLILKK